MKVLAINASPNRGGSTSRLIDLLLAECRNLGAECDGIYMEDYNISDTDISSAMKGTPNYENEDFLQLKARMLEADGIILGTPYYSGKAVETLELFFNQIFSSAFVKKEFKGKYFVGVSTSAVQDATALAKYCANLGYRAQRGGFCISGVLSEATVLEHGLKELAADSSVAKKVKASAQKLISDIATEQKPMISGVTNIMFFGTLNDWIFYLKGRINFWKIRRSAKKAYMETTRLVNKDIRHGHFLSILKSTKTGKKSRHII